jgi:hypothetical protein
MPGASRTPPRLEGDINRYVGRSTQESPHRRHTSRGRRQSPQLAESAQVQGRVSGSQRNAGFLRVSACLQGPAAGSAVARIQVVRSTACAAARAAEEARGPSGCALRARLPRKRLQVRPGRAVGASPSGRRTRQALPVGRSVSTHCQNNTIWCTQGALENLKKAQSCLRHTRPFCVLTLASQRNEYSTYRKETPFFDLRAQAARS